MQQQATLESASCRPSAARILALHAGHNSGACILDRSGILFAIQEERLTGEKNFWGFPRRAIAACLERTGTTADQLLEIAYGGTMVLSRYHSRADVLYSFSRYSTLTGALRQRVLMPLAVTLSPRHGQVGLLGLLGEMGLTGVPVVHYDHHLSHAATAYYGLRTGPAEKLLVLTCDGVGDGVCTTARVMGPGENRLLAATPWGHSLGSLYTWVTYLLGFMPQEHEYKLMGMAPYADPKAARQTAKIFEQYLGLSPDGLTFRRQSGKMAAIYRNLKRDLAGLRFDHICGGLQYFTEELLCQWTANVVKATGIGRVVAAGGVFMNVKANQRIAALPEVESFEAFPSCGDETLPLGAGYLAAAKHFLRGERTAADDVLFRR